MSLSLAQSRLLVILSVFIIAIFINLYNFGLTNQFALLGKLDQPYLKVAFLDIGQGDAIFIETPDGVQMLIDGGPDNSVLRELSKQMPIFDRSIDIVMATHSDKDHIGGLVDVLKSYEVKNVVKSENINDTNVSEAFDTAVEAEETDVHIARAGQVYDIGASTTLLILSPQGDATNWETNTASIVAMLQYGETEFILTGDAPINIEEYIATSYGELIEAEVLKLGHHGSRTSTSDLFLDTIKPDLAIVSAGLDNSYGHPHQEEINKLKTRDIKVFNTAESGTIVLKSDGKEVWVE